MVPLASTATAEGIEICRRALLGHEYWSLSGLVFWYGDYPRTATWEDDNYMLTQQVVAFVLKCGRSVKQGGPLPHATFEILSHSSHTLQLDVLNCNEYIARAFARRCRCFTFRVLEREGEMGATQNGLLVEYRRTTTAIDNI